MKRSNLFSKYLVAMVIAAMIFQVGCKREQGFYEGLPINNETSLNTYEYLKSKPGLYDSLLFLVDKLGIKQTLIDSTVTLFAPSNASFQLAIKNLNDIRKAQGQTPVYLAQIAAGAKPVTVAKLKPKAIRDSSHLDTMVSRYIIRGLFAANRFAIGDGLDIKSVRGGYPMHGQRVFADAEGYQNGGSEVIEFANTKRSLFVAKWSKTTTTSVNIKTKNGLVHLLRPDHVFGFDEFVPRLTLVPPPPSVFDLVNDQLFPKWPDGAEYDGRVSPGETFKRCLDGSVLTKFICNWSNTNQTRMYWIPKVPPPIVNCYTMTSANDSKTYQNRDPKAFTLQGTLSPTPSSSTPDAEWVTIDTRQDQVWTTNYQQKIFDFDNTVRYTGYRLIINQIGVGGNLFQISEWTMNYREKL